MPQSESILPQLPLVGSGSGKVSVGALAADSFLHPREVQAGTDLYWLNLKLSITLLTIALS
jgi:hypothetical protein